MREPGVPVPPAAVEFIEDKGGALAEAEMMNLCLPGLGLAKPLYVAVCGQGNVRKGTHALMMAIEHICGVER